MFLIDLLKIFIKMLGVTTEPDAVSVSFNKSKLVHSKYRTDALICVQQVNKLVKFIASHDPTASFEEERSVDSGVSIYR